MEFLINMQMSHEFEIIGVSTNKLPKSAHFQNSATETERMSI